jgi:signal transduction histidine kinase
VGSSATERSGGVARPVPERVGAVFRLLMQLRTLVALVTLLLLPYTEWNASALLLLLSLAALSWLAGTYWERIVAQLIAHPLLFALDMFVSFAALGIKGPTGPFFLSTVVTSAVAGLLYRWPGMLTVTFFQIATYAAILSFTSDGLTTFQSSIGQPLYYPLFGFAGVALRRLLDEHDRQEVARRLAEVSAAAAEERARLAREMHDSLAKTLRGIALSASALPLWVSRDGERALAEAERISAAIEIASREARGLITGLRDDAVTIPLPTAIRQKVVEWGTEHGVGVRCELDPEADVPLRARYETLSILSEALVNVARHARAQNVEVRLARLGDEVSLTLSDDGRGFQLPELPELAREGHFGLVGLHERAKRIGGSVSVSSCPGAGTVVVATLPAEMSMDVNLAEVS